MASNHYKDPFIAPPRTVVIGLAIAAITAIAGIFIGLMTWLAIDVIPTIFGTYDNSIANDGSPLVLDPVGGFLLLVWGAIGLWGVMKTLRGSETSRFVVIGYSGVNWLIAFYTYEGSDSFWGIIWRVFLFTILALPIFTLSSKSATRFFGSGY